MVMTINGSGDARSFMPDTFPIVAYRREPGLRITKDVCHRKSQPFQKWRCLQLSATAAGCGEAPRSGRNALLGGGSVRRHLSYRSGERESFSDVAWRTRSDAGH
jgi:hypothetical protein